MTRQYLLRSNIEQVLALKALEATTLELNEDFRYTSASSIPTNLTQPLIGLGREVFATWNQQGNYI